MKTLSAASVVTIAMLFLAAPDGLARSGSQRDAGVSFGLADVKVSNVQGAQLTIDEKARTAVWDHCCDGGKWKARFTWRVPEAMNVGQSYPIELGITIDSFQSGGPSGFQMNVLGPDFAEAINVQAPSPGRGTRTVTFLARDYLKDQKEFSLTIGFLSGGVTYTYRRGAAPRVTTVPPPVAGGMSFRLADVKASNVQGAQLRIDENARTAFWDHCCDGGKWKARFTWRVPDGMNVGQSYPIALGITIDSFQSGGPSGFQMNVLGPDLAEALNVQAPSPGRGTRTVTFLARDYLKNQKEFSLTIGFLSGGVTYTYRR